MKRAVPDRIHLVGVGGDGMAALADYLCDMTCSVSGSDLKSTPTLNRLVARGLRLYHDHDASHMSGAEMLVVSDAVPSGNPEIAEARLRDLPVLRRAAFLNRLAAEKTSVFVAGAHGKSTTTAMIATVLERAGLEPSYVIGADAACLGERRARYGAGAHFVGEACEAFNNLAPLRPDIAVITNIDDDHMEHYGTQHKIDLAFSHFAQAARKTAIINGDDSGVAKALADTTGPFTRFGFSNGADVRIVAYGAHVGGTRLTLALHGQPLGDIRLRVVGRHNALNAAACVAACLALGVSFEEIATGLADFTGVARRWEDHGEVAGVRVIDDYAHHPTELAACIDTARALLAPDGRLVLAFQPLLASRTQRLHAAFAQQLHRADLVLLLDTDTAGERLGDNTHLIADALEERVVRLADVDELAADAPRHLRAGDLLVIAGAGDIRCAAAPLKASLQAFANRQKHVGAGSRSDGFAHGADSVVTAFRAHAQAAPHQVAGIDGAHSLSYGQLDRQSDAVAGALIARDLKGAVIGVSLPSSFDLLIAQVAIAKAGATALPLDATLPNERARFMCTQANAKALIAAPTVPWGHGLGLEHVTIEALLDEAGDSRPPLSGTVAARAYICFTSGSTGRPKGVPIRHDALAAFIREAVACFDISADTRMALNTSIGFDVAQGEFWMTLCGGGALCVTRGDRPLVGARLVDFLERTRVTHLAVTPTVLTSAPLRDLPALRCIIAAGEPLSAGLVATWGKDRAVFNAYGPTEATIYATVSRCTPGARVGIGEPLAHVQARVLDESLQPVADGETGELFLGGIGVTEGYLAQSDNADRFAAFGAERFYRTGDLVRRNKDGSFAYLGRRDQQIKLRGMRIELEEIERVLASAPGAQDAACLLMDRGTTQDIVAVVARTPGAALHEAQIRVHAGQWLAPAMLPARIVVVNALPLTSSGKKDRQGLMRLVSATPATRPSQDFSPPRTPLEQELALLWRSVLAAPRDLSAYDDFTDLGGDSLRALMLIAAIEERFGVSVPPGFFESITTIAAMAVQMNDLLWEDPNATAAVETGFHATRVYQQQRHVIARWKGDKATDKSLIRSAGGADPRFDLFVCVQYEDEWSALVDALGPAFRVHGMRSGHLLMTYAPENVSALADHYLDEIAALKPRGQIVLGGVCQGGTIVHAMAQKLIERGHQPPPLFFVEAARLPAYDGSVGFVYGEESPLNPHMRFDNGLARFDDIYGERYWLDVLPGKHGTFHHRENVPLFAQTLCRRLGIEGALG